MSSPSPGTTVEVTEETQKKGNDWVTTTVIYIAIIPALFALFFHLGAAYLSYKKYGSMMWAILDFFFAIFYYPYYAFFLNGSDTPAPVVAPTPIMGGKRRKH